VDLEVNYYLGHVKNVLCKGPKGHVYQCTTVCGADDIHSSLQWPISATKIHQ